MSVLLEPTLVLNKSWMPIDSTSVRDALCNVMSERAVFLTTPDYMQHDMYSWMQLPTGKDEQCIKTACGEIKVPEIILLSEYSKIPVRKVVFCRRNLWRRDGRRCQYCGLEPPMDEITIDHIVPRSKGGESTFKNCVLCCIPCNLKKGSRDLKHTGMRLRRHKRLRDGTEHVVYYDNPRRPVWNPLYALRRKKFPDSWGAFLKNFDEALYWEVGLEP